MGFLQENLTLNNEPCMSRPTLIDLIPVELNYYPFMISIEAGSCNSIDDSFMERCIQRETKDVNAEVFDMITKIYMKIYDKYIKI